MILKTHDLDVLRLSFGSGEWRDGPAPRQHMMTGFFALQYILFKSIFSPKSSDYVMLMFCQGSYRSDEGHFFHSLVFLRG